MAIKIDLSGLEYLVSINMSCDGDLSETHVARESVEHVALPDISSALEQAIMDHVRFEGHVPTVGRVILTPTLSKEELAKLTAKKNESNAKAKHERDLAKARALLRKDAEEKRKVARESKATAKSA